LLDSSHCRPTRSKFSMLRPVRESEAPKRAKWMAVAAPMPELAPENTGETKSGEKGRILTSDEHHFTRKRCHLFFCTRSCAGATPPGQPAT